MQDEVFTWLVVLYVVVGALLYARTWRHRRDGRVVPRVAEFPRASLFTSEGERRLRFMWRFYGVGALVLVVMLLARGWVGRG